MTQAASIADVFKELRAIRQHMVSKEELFSVLETMEILHNPTTMRQIRASEQDIRAGRTKTARGIKDILDEPA